MLLEILEALTGVFVVVYDGEHALKYTLGRAQEVVGPGVHWKWPVVQRFAKRGTRHTTLDLEPQVIQLSDDLVYEVGAKVVYQIVDLRKAVVEVDDLVEGLKNRLTIAVLVDEVVAELDDLRLELGRYGQGATSYYRGSGRKVPPRCSPCVAAGPSL